MNKIERVTVDLSAEESDQIERLVSSGEYESPGDVMRAGLNALLEHDRAVERWLRTDVVDTYDKVKSGEMKTVPIEDVFAELKTRHAARRPAE